MGYYHMFTPPHLPFTSLSPPSSPPSYQLLTSFYHPFTPCAGDWHQLVDFNADAGQLLNRPWRRWRAGGLLFGTFRPSPARRRARVRVHVGDADGERRAARRVAGALRHAAQCPSALILLVLGALRHAAQGRRALEARPRRPAVGADQPEVRPEDRGAGIAASAVMTVAQRDVMTRRQRRSRCRPVITAVIIGIIGSQPQQLQSKGVPRVVAAVVGALVGLVVRILSKLGPPPRPSP
eukprot:gene13936-biopygen13001